MADTIAAIKRREKTSSANEISGSNGQEGGRSLSRRSPKTGSLRKQLSAKHVSESKSQGMKSSRKKGQKTSAPRIQSRRRQDPAGAVDGDLEGNGTRRKQRSKAAGKSVVQESSDDTAADPETKLGTLTPVPEHDLKERQRKNPRESPKEGVDLDYG